MSINKFTEEYKFLSNFCECDVKYEGVTYPTTEHAFQAAKSYDVDDKKMILECKTPLIAKRKGRTVKLRSDWEEVKNGIMADILRTKFHQPLFKKLLLETGDKDIIEGNNWHDNYWGICFCKNCGNKGENILGKIIKTVRDELKNI